MRVLFIPDIYEEGGAYNSFVDMVRLLNLKYDIDPIILASKKGNYTVFAESCGYEYHVIGHKGFYLSMGATRIRKVIKLFLVPYFFIRYKYCNEKALRYICNNVDMASVDIIHSNVNRNDIGAILSTKYAIPHVWHIREYGTVKGYGKNSYHFISLRNNYIDFMNKNTSKFIAVSEAVADCWVRRGINRDKIRVIYNGINQEKFSDKKKSISRNIRIVMVGFISPQKGQLKLIESVMLLPKEIRNKLFIDFYGKGTKEYIKTINSRIKNTDISKRVSFKGYVSNIHDLLPQYDIGVVSTVAEGFGRVIVEYMLSGVCVISADTGPSREIIEDGVSGLLYEYGSNEALASCIYRLCDENERKRICEEAQKQSGSRFTADIMVTRIYEVYKEIYEERR